MGNSILIVDIDSENNDINKKYLECHGFEVNCVETANEAIEILNTSKPDLVITEIMLENNDSGFSLAYHAKKKYPEIGVIILTDVVRKTGIEFELNTEDEKSWIKADDWINKPINPAVLVKKINKLIK